MTSSTSARPSAARIRIRRFILVGLLGVVAAIAAASGSNPLATASSTAPSPRHRVLPERRLAPRHPDAAPARPSRARAFGEADGVVPDDVTIFDDAVPGVANLEPDLLGALRDAATDAGVAFVVASGWRSRAYQRRLLEDAVSTYGSEAAAARWVAAPERSAHVSGDAVDLGSDAAAWLSKHGAAHGLCQTYGNEPWHYELRREAVASGCPPPYPDPTHDPRLQP